MIRGAGIGSAPVWPAALAAIVIACSSVVEPALAAHPRPHRPDPDAYAPPPVSPAQLALAHQIELTEQAFAGTVSQVGIGPGFRRFAAKGAVMFTPDPSPAGPYLAAAKSPGELIWRPHFIGVAPSGDLGFSLGPSLYKSVGKAEAGYYITIWKRAPDGAWQFVLDRGADMPSSVLDTMLQPTTVIGSDPAAKPDSSQGLREADGSLNMDLARQTPDAFAARLDYQAVVVRANHPVASRRKRVLRLLATTPPMQDAQIISAGVSADGMLGYTYGKARWMAATGMQQGYYVRVWRNGGQGWRLLVDHLADR